jgi:hypothetical protein
MTGRIKWQSKNVALAERAFLCCFGDKCMSGMVKKLREIAPDYFEIELEFIEPRFFQHELFAGNRFTINEASRILGEGIVTAK